jgi:hypothetical protein
MNALRGSIATLLDEGIPIAQRLDKLFPKGRPQVKKLGKAIITSILLIAFPDKYGVWNGTSESALRELDLWPNFERGASIGQRYGAINEMLLKIASDLDTDLWTLDALWWRVFQPAEEIVLIDQENGQVDETGHRFGLERHLHDFLFDNWNATCLAKDWMLVEEGGDVKGYGYERPTSIGRIDLLARHKSEPRWLVIELKRSQGSDDTLGQIQRYMGWVMEELAEDDHDVEGLIIATEPSNKLRFALKATQNISFMRYEVDFQLLLDE